MTDVRDIQQQEFSSGAQALKVLLLGRTVGGAYVEIQVDANGVIQL